MTSDPSGPRPDTENAPPPSDESTVAARIAWFSAYTARKNVFAPVGPEPYTCPCCGHPELSERGGYEICSECGWEDDGQDDHDSAVHRGGPNGPESLDDARRAYRSAGGVPGVHVPPSPPV